MMHILFLNGPPRVGKDLAATFIQKNWFDVKPYKMSYPLKRAVPEFFGVPHEVWKKHVELEKDEPSPWYFGKTPRQVQISMSEEWAKGVWGSDVFGRIAANILGNFVQIGFVAISDSGFRDECIPIVERFGKDRCHVIQIDREGKSFDGDSRSWVDLTDLGVSLHRINNKYDMEMYEQQVIKAVKDATGVSPTASK